VPNFVEEMTEVKRVTILALEKTMASTVTGPLDIFCQAGVLWNQIGGLDPEPRFRVEIATVDGRSVECLNQVRIQPHTSMEDVKHTDLVIISSEDLAVLSEAREEAVPWLVDRFENGASIASVCTGAFLLAETGLLNGKRATTHWGFADEFRKRYPEVVLTPECLITDEGNLFCAGGAHSYFDLALYLVEKYCGYEVASQCARALLLDMGRASQVPFAIFEYQKHHKDKEILRIQNIMEKHYDGEINMHQLAGKAGMSTRNFKRRFRGATGESPLAYLQRYRIEKAKRLLEDPAHSIAEVSYRIGYENVDFFRDLFKRHVHMTPHAFRQRLLKNG
jgi:transcriptional regulator GlxA family with amidase domain